MPKVYLHLTQCGHKDLAIRIFDFVAESQFFLHGFCKTDFLFHIK